MAFELKNIPIDKGKKSNSFDINSLLKKEIHLFGVSFSDKKKEALYTELAVLLQAGLELKEALELLANEQKKEIDRQLLERIIEELIAGRNFSEAIKKQKEFSGYEYYSLQIGEKTGTLQKVTGELGDFFKRKNEQRRTIMNALSYPIVVLITAFLSVIFMLNFVVPMFADIFKQNKVELPWITSQIIKLSDVAKGYYWILFLIMIGLVIFIKIFKKKDWYQKLYTSALLKIPFVGEFVRKVRIAQFTQAISLLVSAKIPLLNGIQLTKKMIEFYPLERALEKIENNILIGKTLHDSIYMEPIFDKKMATLIKVAEETNQTATIFKRLTYQYNQEIESKSKMISAIIEPLIILVLGSIVAIILIAMYLPMFKLSTVIG
ncbi:type II secretion system F family protein [Tenacibaculum maritimum]|uniref:type II secretion system F family protein n=1 Tax=Tenacibaculum maritimum TaxID=107401 RepID=UPI0012E4F06A|nr:type II secretion system F family protein [Tenacibaculum maritimum]CAA0141000.1 Type IV pilus assembly protein PilC [Tenacibaculum maritimum]CAA0165534.1 Type IV pilus assembly protein PilC [Tenacibaculum maritimum]CAA0247408.1 Bacterial type II secretion system F domain protein [Tenacibaculum maritimum]CAA0248952.1 Type IV pilus assembly protein PilC [Tenacibaculum maritimum]CAA0251396.1 Type IV pilus assembly protein PilC [Tenacibaculum maritimum]